MSNDGVNAGRRRFLVAATSVVGAAGAVGAAVPFVGSWFPSAKAKAAGAPVKVNVSKIEPGQQMIAEWRGQPVFIVRRTEEILGNLKKIEGQLSDPTSKNSTSPPSSSSAATNPKKPSSTPTNGLSNSNAANSSFSRIHIMGRAERTQ